MTCESFLESPEYFFKTFSNLKFDNLCIKSYLIALGSDDTSIILYYRDKFDTVDSRIEETYTTEWIASLLPYFKSNQSTEHYKLTTQNEIYLKQKCDVNSNNYLEECSENWSGEPRVLEAFLKCLQRIRQFHCIENHLNKIFPMICQVLDDYRHNFKIKGVQITGEFLRIVPAEIMQKFHLQMVLYESLKVNLSLESDELLGKSIQLWIGLIDKVENFAGKEFLKRSDELLLLLCRDVGTTSKIDRKILFLNSIGQLIDQMKFCAIRYLRKAVVIICEVVKEDWSSNEVVESGTKSIIVIIQNCWVRITEDLKKIILDTFGGNEEIRNLLNSF